jgi:hypothetical protein
MARKRQVVKVVGANLIMDALREVAQKMTPHSVNAKHKAIEMKKNTKGVYEAVARNRSRSK